MWTQSTKLLRIHVLAMLVGAILVLVWAVPGAMAEGQGGNLDTRYSQVRFMTLDKFQIADLRERWERRKTQTKIDRFSDIMSLHILHMADAERRATFRLMNDMSKIKTKKDRLKRLQIEQKRLKKLKGLLEKSIKTLKSKPNTEANRAAIREEVKRLHRTEIYLEGVDIWIENPMEGRL